MDTIVCDIIRTHMQKDFNEALQALGLIVSSIKFEDNTGLSVIIEISINENDYNCAYKNSETLCFRVFTEGSFRYLLNNWNIPKKKTNTV